MKRKMTALREVLPDFRSDFSLCGKCKLCQANHVQEVIHGRFWRNCPSGTRFRFEAYYASGRLEMARALDLQEIEPTETMAHALYTCMECGSCQEQCYPVKQIFPLRVIELLREQAVRDGWGPLEEHQSAIDNLEQTDNLLGKPQAERGQWAEGLGLKDASKEKVGALLFAGCHYSFKPELADAARAAVRVLKAAGLDLGILGSEEACCGAPLLELGDRDFFETFGMENLRRFEATGAEQIISLCPHCNWIFNEEYADEMAAKPKHAVQVVAEALKKKQLAPGKQVKMKVAWHDPCRMGRRLGIYKQPRKILASIPGLEVVEFERSGHNSLCCGNGGMAAYAFPEFGEWTAKERIFEAEFAGVDAIVTSCPWCEEMLRIGAAAKGSSVKVENIFTLLEQSL
jgi:Fe-S oxidoreductase